MSNGEGFSVQEEVTKVLKRPVPEYVNLLHCFGGITFLLFVIEVITGILLAFYYKPSPEAAYDSVKFITTKVTLGWLVRQIHIWGAHLLIIFVFLHLLRVFFQGAYRPPREFNWVVGIVLLFLMLGFGFTGYLLPWNERAFWATVTVTEFARAIPIVGDIIMEVLRGGREISGETLIRFYIVHIVVLPILALLLMLLHFVIIRKQGIAKPL
jgi:quinol-cytochrome oxidoreductase complex cytochrome b subunit